MKRQEKGRFIMKQRFKGVSPLIATVLLIAFTMVIAGIMAAWANTFSAQRLASATAAADCLGVLDLSSLSFNNGTISVKIRNTSGYMNLTDLKATVEYGDVTKNKVYTLKDYNVTDPLPPVTATFFVVSTGNTAKPDKIEVVATNCPQEIISLKFR